MADVLAHTSSFPRGSAVLDYWLLHAEGMTVEPLGATVERVVVPAPFEPPLALVVRSRSGRERVIPAESIAAVEPASGSLMLEGAPRRQLPRPTPGQVAAVRAYGRKGIRLAETGGRHGQRGARAAYRWLRPRTIRAARAAYRQSAAALAWLKPRAAAAARRTGAATVRLSQRALRELQTRRGTRSTVE